MQAELGYLSCDPIMASRIDIQRMKKILEKWPDQAPLNYSEHQDFAMLRWGLLRGIAVSRFINQSRNGNY